MAWIVQEYERDVHIVPDTEPGHVLAHDCFCAPQPEQQPTGVIWTHRDAADRTVKEP